MIIGCSHSRRHCRWRVFEKNTFIISSENLTVDFHLKFTSMAKIKFCHFSKFLKMSESWKIGFS
jgi:hypothetical protein